MNGSKAAARRGSSFGPGPRRGTDPEGAERSSWKGFCGPAGLNLDHARIPDIQRTVYSTLSPLVVAAEEPIPLSQFTQKCCDVLLPVLERQQELGPHEFKSQWGRLNEFVCPELARLAGIPDSGYNRESKTVRIDLKVEASSKPAAPRRTAAAKPLAAAAAGGAAAGAAPTAAGTTSASTHPAMPSGPAPALPPTPGGLPVPVQLAPPAAVTGSASPAVPLVHLPPPCAYCSGPHSMKHCADFHAVLQSIYQAGYQQGMVAAQQLQQMHPAAAAPLAPPAPAPVQPAGAAVNYKADGGSQQY